MLYLEVYCTDGTGWRISLPPESVKISGGTATITDFPTIAVDHPCELMPQWAILSDTLPELGGMLPDTALVRLLTGLWRVRKNLSVGDILYLAEVRITVD